MSAGEEGVPEIGVDASFVNEMEQEILLMSDVVNETTIAQETEAMQEHEKNRDNLSTYILTRITCAGSLPLQAAKLTISKAESSRQMMRCLLNINKPPSRLLSEG